MQRSKANLLVFLWRGTVANPKWFLMLLKSPSDAKNSRFLYIIIIQGILRNHLHDCDYTLHYTIAKIPYRRRAERRDER